MGLGIWGRMDVERDVEKGGERKGGGRVKERKRGKGRVWKKREIRIYIHPRIWVESIEWSLWC